MKLIKHISILFAGIAIACACDPDKLEVNKAYPDSQMVPPVLNTMTTVHVSQANYDSDDLVTFSWKAADFGFTAAPDYALYMKGAKGDVCIASNINATSYSIDYPSLYNRLIGKSYLGLMKGATHKVECYLTATVGTNFSTIVSDPVSVEFEIARISTGINMIYLCGDFNSNDPDSDGLEEDSPGSRTYRGMINMKNPSISSNSFHFVEYTYSGLLEGQRYGGGEGSLSAGGDAIVAETELMWVTVDLNAGTYRCVPLTSVNFAGFNGSWSIRSNPALVYDEGDRSWKCTADYQSGKFRIAFNTGWAYTIGVKSVAEIEIPEKGGEVKLYDNNICKPILGDDGNFKILGTGSYDFRFYYEAADCTWRLSVTPSK